jgi:DNA polymerase III subunit gamma/tau
MKANNVDPTTGHVSRPARQSLAAKYRPHRFDQVYGQRYAVRYLRRLIQRGQVGYPLLLHGAYGSGKTSLIRIYAKALNCLHPDWDDGSPCQACGSCRSNLGFHEYDSTGNRGDASKLLASIAQHAITPRAGQNYNVLFFDEAHGLPAAVTDALLKRVEEPPAGVIVCLATTEYHRIPEALRSRLLDFEIRPLIEDDAVALLEACAAAEGYAYEAGALRLLAGIKRGHARDLLNGLEMVEDQEAGPITIERVRMVFDVDHTPRLVAYLLALAAGDPEQQSEAWFGWEEPAAVKIGWLQAALAALYYNELLSRSLLVDAVVASIPKTDRSAIVTAFQARLGLAEASALIPFWLTMMAFWPMPGTEPDERALQLRVALFHHMVNHDLPRMVAGAPLPGAEPALAPVPTRAIMPPPLAAPATPACVSTLPEPGFMTAADVHRILAAASFLPQEHGVLFNARFDVCPAAFGVEEEAPARALIAEFHAALQAEVAAHADGLFARLSLVERPVRTGGDVRARVLAHLPAANAHEHQLVRAHVETWVQTWRPRMCCEVGVVAINFETAAGERDARLKFHWNGVVDLCAGLDAGVMARDAQGAEAPLLVCLGVGEKRRRRTGPIVGARVEVSEALDEAAMAAACRNHMGLLSAAAARRWDWLRTGWELREHSDRRDEQRRRDAVLARIARDFGDTPRAQAERDAHLRAWEKSPERRERNWEGWWSPAIA